MRHPSLRRATITATTALLAASVALPVGAGEIETQADGEAVPAVRYAGDDRYETSALIATDDTSNGSTHAGDSVILARGDAFPDGLAGSLLSGSVDAPVLLTETDALPDSTREAIDELAPTTIYLLGGPVAISPDLEDELEGEGYTVERLAGEDRYATAADIASNHTGDGVTTGIVALGTNFPDALVAGPISAVGGHPLLLTEKDTLPQVTADTIEDLGLTTILLAGGTDAISDAVQTALEDLDVDVQRVSGATRYDTALEFADWAVDNLGFTTNHVNLATGESFPDALSLAAHAAADYSGPAPIVLTQTATLPESTETWLRDHASAGNTAIHVGGGTVAIEDDVVDAARAAYSPAGWTTPQMFAAGMMVDRAETHLQAFQDIADANGDTRASSTAGYGGSLDYVRGLLDDAGYETTVQPFTFDYFEENSDPTFEQTAGDDNTPYPHAFDLADGPDDSDADFATMSYSGTADVTDDITPVDLAIGDEENSTSGCEADDFAGFTADTIALVQRGACSFAQKAENAFDAGATGVIIFNQGNGADRTDVFFGTLGGPVDTDDDGDADGPVISTSYDLGVALNDDDEAGTGVEVHIAVDALNVERSSRNLLAETPGGDPENVVMAGAHLDSVPEGPGINDNGSGSAAVLETALQLARSEAPIQNKLRFAWWGAEESGLIGSTHYVDEVLINEDFTGLTPEGEAVALYLNFDMVGSPNFARFIYDGDGSEFDFGDAGSGVIEKGFEDFFDAADLAHEPTEFSGRSDYAEFQVAEIPTGGLFTGAEGIKSAAQEAKFGGVAGTAFDPNYHKAGDTILNVHLGVFEEMIRAVAHEVYTYAGSTHDVDAAVAASSDGGGRAPASAEERTAVGGEYRGNHAVR